MEKKKASIKCSLCKAAIFEGRTITDRAYRAARRHILIDHAEGEDAECRRGRLTFRDNGRSTQAQLTVYPHEWDAKKGVPSFYRPPQTPRWSGPRMSPKARKELAAYAYVVTKRKEKRLAKKAKRG